MKNKMKIFICIHRLVLFLGSIFVASIAFGFVSESLGEKVLPWLASYIFLYLMCDLSNSDEMTDEKKT